MHTHFCPTCGKALRQGDCKIERRFGAITRISCPHCGVSAPHSGGMLIVAGIIVAIVGGFIMPVEVVALVVGGGFCFVGLIRLVRQVRAARLYVSTHKDA